jgi:SAM-dependent methyltransferase
LHVSGRELEKELVANMKKDSQLRDVDIDQGDITKLIGHEEYDIVIASDVIEHIKDDEKALKNLWSFVKPSGQLVITVPAHQYLYGKRDIDWGHFRRYSKEFLTARLSALDGDIEFLGFWNTVGYFVYYLYEKILHKKINEELRYTPSLKGKIVRTILGGILKTEKYIGGTPIGLTLVAVVRK